MAGDGRTPTTSELVEAFVEVGFDAETARRGAAMMHDPRYFGFGDVATSLMESVVARSPGAHADPFMRERIERVGARFRAWQDGVTRQRLQEAKRLQESERPPWRLTGGSPSEGERKERPLAEAQPKRPARVEAMMREIDEHLGIR